jgi:hypothetical protein
VKDLKVAWTFSMASTTEAVNEFTPLVHDGVLFLWNFGARAGSRTTCEVEATLRCIASA